jgi:hypothetical protein
MRTASTKRTCGIRLRQAHARLRRRNTAMFCDRLDYKAAGVDINAGNELVNRIKKLNPDIGGFNGMFPFGELRSCPDETTENDCLSYF